jgi:hypothetical protein
MTGVTKCFELADVVAPAAVGVGAAGVKSGPRSPWPSVTPCYVTWVGALIRPARPHKVRRLRDGWAVEVAANRQVRVQLI